MIWSIVKLFQSTHVNNFLNIPSLVAVESISLIERGQQKFSRRNLVPETVEKCVVFDDGVFNLFFDLVDLRTIYRINNYCNVLENQS